MRIKRATKVIALTTIVVACSIGLWHEARKARQGALRSQCQSNLRQIGHAILNYQDVNGHLPAPRQKGKDGIFFHSWRVAVLPFLGAESLFERYDYSATWDSKENAATARDIGPYFLMNCPLCTVDVPSTSTDFVAIVGPGTVFGDGAPRHIADEYSSANPDKIIVCEMSESGITWTEPRDVTIEQVLERYCSLSDANGCIHYDNGVPLVHVLRLDGTVESLQLPANRADLTRRIQY